MKIRVQEGFQPFLFLLALLKYLPQLQEGMYTSVLANSLTVRHKGSSRVISVWSLFNKALTEEYFFFQTFCGKYRKEWKIRLQEFKKCIFSVSDIIRRHPLHNRLWNILHWGWYFKSFAVRTLNGRFGSTYNFLNHSWNCFLKHCWTHL